MRIGTLLRIAVAISVVLAVSLIVLNLVNASMLGRINQAQNHANTVEHTASDLMALTQEYALYAEPRAAQQWRAQHATLVRLLETKADETLPIPHVAMTEAKTLGVLFQRLAEMVPDSSKGDLQARQKNLLLDQLQTSNQILTDAVRRWNGAATQARDEAELTHV